MGNLIITLERQYGSGGKEVGTALAKRLGIPLYDDDIPDLAAERSGISKDYFQKADEKPTDSFLYALAMNSLSINSVINPFDNVLSSDRLFNKQAEVIRQLAAEGPCVIIGRCAGYILREETKCIRVFLWADKDFRMKRLMQLYHLSERDAVKAMNSMDKKRESYFGYYSGLNWNSWGTYDLSICTSKFGVESAVDMICGMLDIVENKNESK